MTRFLARDGPLLNGNGVMLNDCLDQNYMRNVMEPYKIQQTDRQHVAVARWSQAFALVSSGTAYFVVENNYRQPGPDGAYPGPNGAYQWPLPDPPEAPPGEIVPNVWRKYEFGALQRNTAITQVITVAWNEGLVNNAQPQRTDWQTNQTPPAGGNVANAPDGINVPFGGQIPFFDANSLAVPPIANLQPKVPAGGSNLNPPQDPAQGQSQGQGQGQNQGPQKRQNPSSASNSTCPMPSLSLVSAMVPSLPTMSPSSPSSSPALEPLSSRIIESLSQPASSAPPAPSAPTTTPSPAMAVHLSNNTVHVGNIQSVINGKNYTDTIFADLQPLCPDPASGQTGICDTSQTKQIDNVNTVSDGWQIDGTLVFQFQDSSYDSSSARDIMLANAVSAFYSAANNTCQEVYSIFSPPSSSQSYPAGRPAKIKRLGVPGEGGVSPTSTCHGKLAICGGPDHISKSCVSRK